MTLIKSISGIRGTIGGAVGQGLTPIDVVKFTAAFATLIESAGGHKKIVVGRDARVSGKAIGELVGQTLFFLGWEVLDLGLATTPTVEMAVPFYEAAGGIILTASHNPANWNALKLLNGKGEFISHQEGQELLGLAEREDFNFSTIDELGKISQGSFLSEHIEAILALDLVDVDAIKSSKFKIAVDAVNSVGGLAVPALLRALGVETIVELYCTPTGKFPHNPEPLPENITELSSTIVDQDCDLGIVVDPDVDRLAFVCEDGSAFGEEYTLVAISDFVLAHTPGDTVSNLSSTRALRDVTEKRGGKYFPAAVGEVNVVAKMKETNAIIGGEGNGGIIFPELHYGRDALVGIALFLTYLAQTKAKASLIRASLPNYHISKNKIAVSQELNLETLLESIREKYVGHDGVQISTIDGVKIDFANEWIHLRKSNTEPIIRIYAESSSIEKADHLAKKMIEEISSIL